jgi:hypothetical protein
VFAKSIAFTCQGWQVGMVVDETVSCSGVSAASSAAVPHPARTFNRAGTRYFQWRMGDASFSMRPPMARLVPLPTTRLH